MSFCVFFTSIYNKFSQFFLLLLICCYHFPYFRFTTVATECLREYIKSMVRLFIIFFFIQKTKQQPKKTELIETFSCIDESTPVECSSAGTTTKKITTHEKSNQDSDCDVRDQCQSMKIRISKHCLCDFQSKCTVTIYYTYSIRPVCLFASNWFAFVRFIWSLSLVKRLNVQQGAALFFHSVSKWQNELKTK